MTSGIRPPEISGRRDPQGRTGHQGETEARCEQAGARLAALVEVTEGGEERERRQWLLRSCPASLRAPFCLRCTFPTQLYMLFL